MSQDVALSGWGRATRSVAHLVPVRAADDVRLASRDAAPRGHLARGLGRSYGDAAQNAGGTVFDMTGLGGIGLDPATGRATVGAGVSLHEVLREVVPRGWFPAVTPGTRYVTVGGAIAADIHGKNHHVDGSFVAQTDWITLRTGEGVRTVTRESDPDAWWATAGGMGLTGVILEAQIRLLPVETSRVRVDTERAGDLDDLMARMTEGDQRYRYSVAWIDLLARGAATGRGVLTRGDHATREELGGRDAPLAYEADTLVAAPAAVPSGLLNRLSVRAFNEFWFRKAPRGPRTSIESIGAFFYPLDGVAEWHRLYGARGFVQYQFVVPDGQEDTLRRVVGMLSDAQYPSFLAVLKRFGPQEGLLSFPMPGWTLALDVPLGRRDLGPFLDGLDELVLAAGGRVYLAKDARLRPGMAAAMYPQLARWREIQARMDPGGSMNSDLARRLRLLEGRDGA